jgi:hypothetical protein
VNFLSTSRQNAAATLGAVPHPATVSGTVDLDTGKYWLDVLGMIRDKTKGNLSPQESRLARRPARRPANAVRHDGSATEEKLKTQAAKKFSDADILGKK